MDTKKLEPIKHEYITVIYFSKNYEENKENIAKLVLQFKKDYPMFTVNTLELGYLSESEFKKTLENLDKNKSIQFYMFANIPYDNLWNILKDFNSEKDLMSPLRNMVSVLTEDIPEKKENDLHN